MEKENCFEHKNSGLFLPQFNLDETQEYMNLFHNSSRYEWLWLDKNIDKLTGYGFVKLIDIAKVFDIGHYLCCPILCQ
jgi:hypothetical protein